MRFILPQLTKNEYISALKQNMDSHFRLFKERCTGFFFGSVFIITYHSDIIWVGTTGHRRPHIYRYTAIGYARHHGTSTEVRYFPFLGLLAPQYLIPLFLFYSYLFYNISYPEMQLIAYSGSGQVVDTVTSTVVNHGLMSSLGLTAAVLFLDFLDNLRIDRRYVIKNLLRNPTEFSIEDKEDIE